MGIWIKSQDGGLGEYTKFLPPVVNREEKPDPEVPCCIVYGKVLNAQIMGCDMNGRIDVLGTYLTEAEALQVLDMIERRIDDNACTELAGPECNGYIRPVFQMPPAGFSEKPEKFYPECGGDFCGLIDPAKADEITPYNHCSQIGTCKAAWERGCR